jgi:hypothetical protein
MLCCSRSATWPCCCTWLFCKDGSEGCYGAGVQQVVQEKYARLLLLLLDPWSGCRATLSCSSRPCALLLFWRCTSLIISTRLPHPGMNVRPELTNTARYQRSVSRMLRTAFNTGCSPWLQRDHDIAALLRDHG